MIDASGFDERQLEQLFSHDLDFRKLYMNEFAPTERDLFLRQLAKEYHERCEQYDRGVCSGMRDGIAMPTNNREMREINVNARRVFNELAGRAAEKGISMDELTREIQRCA